MEIHSDEDSYELISTALTEAIIRLVRQSIWEVRESLEHTMAAALRAGPDTAVMVGMPEAAKRLGLGESTVRKLAADGDLQSVLVGERRLVPVDALTEYVERLKVETA